MPWAPRPRRLLAVALAAVMAWTPVLASAQPLPGAAGPAPVRLPALGDASSEDLPIGTERRYGEQVMREIRLDPAYLDDPVLLEYAQSLWAPLVAAARQRGDIGAETQTAFAWELFLVLDRSVNAFALPGGHVGLHLGLIAITATRDELAGVLAHELSHVTQRHIARSIANAGRQSTLGIVAMLLGVLAASRSSNPDIAQAAVAGGQAAMIQGQLNFSRDMEREADRIGYGLFVDAGFAPAGMAGMFDKLDQAGRLNDSGAFPYLRSHPLTVERLAEARSRLTMGGVAAPEASAQAIAQGHMHSLMQARARVLMEPNVIAQRRQLDQLTATHPFRERLGVLYGAVMAATRLGEHAVADRAAAELERLVGADPAVPRLIDARPIDPGLLRAVRLLRAETLLARGDGPGARQALAALPAGPLQRPVMLLAAEAALKSPAGDRQALRAATEQLQTWVAERRDDAAAWALLGRAADALGLRLRSLRAQAEARAALGDLGAAIDRLRAAQTVSRGVAGADLIEASVIDTRLRELLAQRRQLLAEQRGGRGGERGGDRGSERGNERGNERGGERGNERGSDSDRSGGATGSGSETPPGR